MKSNTLTRLKACRGVQVVMKWPQQGKKNGGTGRLYLPERWRLCCATSTSVLLLHLRYKWTFSAHLKWQMNRGSLSRSTSLLAIELQLAADLSACCIFNIFYKQLTRRRIKKEGTDYFEVNMKKDTAFRLAALWGFTAPFHSKVSTLSHDTANMLMF